LSKPVARTTHRSTDSASVLTEIWTIVGSRMRHVIERDLTALPPPATAIVGTSAAAAEDLDAAFACFLRLDVANGDASGDTVRAIAANWGPGWPGAPMWASTPEPPPFMTSSATKRTWSRRDASRAPSATSSMCCAASTPPRSQQACAPTTPPSASVRRAIAAPRGLRLSVRGGAGAAVSGRATRP
jgi:hypothetical protein